MARVTILGAGDMGTALVTPLAHNGHEVRLWGTERDSAIVATLRAGDEHPRLRVRVPAACKRLRRKNRRPRSTTPISS